MKRLILSALLLCTGAAYSAPETVHLQEILAEAHPFKHDLHPTIIPGENSKVMLCLHGFGLSYKYAEKIEPHLDHTLISFNFPDYGSKDKKYQLNSRSEERRVGKECRL